MAPLKLAIIGGGPSSFYVASRLLSLFPKDELLSSQLKIHIYDRLWVPHGLVRYGVAPDHPEVKARFPLTPASSLSKPFSSPIELHAQVPPSCGGLWPTLLWQRPGRAPDAAADLTRLANISLRSEAPLHAPPLFHRLHHPHLASCPAAV